MVLPSALAQDTVTILVNIQDALGGLTNVTQEVQITSIKEQLLDGMTLHSFLDTTVANLDLLNPVAKQDSLGNLLIAAQELSTLFYEYQNDTQMVRTLSLLYGKLKNLNGKLSS